MIPSVIPSSFRTGVQDICFTSGREEDTPGVGRYNDMSESDPDAKPGRAQVLEFPPAEVAELADALA